MHSLVDSANQLLLVVGLRSAAAAPDKRHQYGYGEDREKDEDVRPRKGQTARHSIAASAKLRHTQETSRPPCRCGRLQKDQPCVDRHGTARTAAACTFAFCRRRHTRRLVAASVLSHRLTHVLCSLCYFFTSGKSVYFWALVSALGTFWLGAGVSMRHSIEELINPTVALDKVSFCCLSSVFFFFSARACKMHGAPGGSVGQTSGMMVARCGCHRGSPCRSGCHEAQQFCLPLSASKRGSPAHC